MSNESEPMPAVQEVALQTVRKTLGRSTDVDTCCRLSSQINELLVQAGSQLQEPGAALACRLGCNFCCYMRVMVHPHEAIALFRYLQSRMPAMIADQVRARVREYAKVPDGATQSTATTRRACAFLVDGSCAAYEVRPNACASYHSLSMERCQQSFENPAVPAGTVALQSLQAVSLALEEGMIAALDSHSLDFALAELHVAVAALLDKPALVARWRAGRPLLRTIRTGA